VEFAARSRTEPAEWWRCGPRIPAREGLIRVPGNALEQRYGWEVRKETFAATRGTPFYRLHRAAKG